MKIRTFFLLLKNRAPIFSSNEGRRSVLVWTSRAKARAYQNARTNEGEDTFDIEEWKPLFLVKTLESYKSVLEKGGVEWVMVDHPGRSAKKVLHLRLEDVLGLESNRPFRAIRDKSTQGS